MYSFQSKIRYSEVDEQGTLTETALLDYFQDCSVFQSEENQIGLGFLKDHQLAWVLSSWQIHIVRLPKLGELVETATWPYGMKGFYGYRNFTMKDEQGQMLAYANSIWVLMNIEKGHPTKIPEYLAEIYGMDPPLEMEKTGRRVEALPGGEALEKIVVPSYFIDTNKHMNNSKYMLVAKEYLPSDFTAATILVEYKKAALEGEHMVPVVARDGHVMTVSLNSEDGKSYAILRFIENRV